MKKIFFSIFLVSPLLFADASTDDRLDKLEKAVDKLDMQVGLLLERSKLMVERTTISFPNANYLAASLSLILPRARTFTYPTDTGLGVSLGYGHYFSRHHVVEGNLDWDLYPGLSLRYRYEWRGNATNVSFGPVIGLKCRLISGRPMDNFLDSREDLNGTMGIAGFFVSLPAGRSIIHTEVVAFFYKQVVINATLGLHLFL